MEAAAAEPRGLKGLPGSHTRSDNIDGGLIHTNLRDQKNWDRANMALYHIPFQRTTGTASSLVIFKLRSGAHGDGIIAVWLAFK